MFRRFLKYNVAPLVVAGSPWLIGRAHMAAGSDDSRSYKRGSGILATSPASAEQVATPHFAEDPDVSILSGSANRALSEKVVLHLKRHLSEAEVAKFSDGEIFINIKESMRGKDVFIIQSCAPPVNDSVIELLLTIAAAKRSGASTVTAVIPYFGYKLNRRGLPISTTHHSRFLWSAAADISKM